MVSNPDRGRADSLTPTLISAEDGENAALGNVSSEPRPKLPRALPGTLIGGSYRLVRELGKGAMGVVWLALDERLERRVAIKLIRDDVLAPGFQERFMLEARAMAQVNHPNVVGIHAFGDHEGTPYFVTELVEGVTLEAWLSRRERPPDLESALQILNEVCHAVSAIHAAGTVHRDLKPSNILIGAGLRTRVADFGISVRPSNHSSGVGEVAGTPAYMAPEVALSEGKRTAPSPLSDLYSLGCIAFEVLTGRRPFCARGQLAWLVQHMTATVPAASAIRPDLPRGYDRVLRKALAKAPVDRTPSVEAFRRDLTVTALEPERILVADDDADFRELMRATLQREFRGAAVECVGDGLAALDAAERQAASIALIDLRLPVLDGAALTRALRHRERKGSTRMPIIVLTGRGGASEWQTLSHLGADRFLVKPVHLGDLMTLIRHSMAQTFGLPVRYAGTSGGAP